LNKFVEVEEAEEGDDDDDNEKLVFEDIVIPELAKKSDTV